MMKKNLKRLFFLLLSAALFIAVALEAAHLFRIEINLQPYKTNLEKILSTSLGRQVQIGDSISLGVALFPQLNMSNVRVANPEGFEKPFFVCVDVAQLKFNVFSLLSRRLHLLKLNIAGLALNLEENAQGHKNWLFPSKHPVPENRLSGQQSQKGLTTDAIYIRRMALQDVRIEFHSDMTNTNKTYQIQQCTGSMLPNKPVDLILSGKYQQMPFTSCLQIASMQELLHHKRTWAQLKTNICSTNFAFTGTFNMEQANRQTTLKTVVYGKDLSSLAPLFQTRLPTLKNYRLESTATLTPGKITFDQTFISVNQNSTLEGSASLYKKDGKTNLEANLQSKMIQLNDFKNNLAKPQNNVPEKAAEKATKKHGKRRVELDIQQQKNQLRKFLSAQILGKFNAHINLRADQVMSGQDELGAGTAEITLHNSTLTLSPLDLHLPGGKILISASLTPDNPDADAYLTVQAENFDFGILARRSSPETKMGGIVNLYIDIQAKAGSFRQLMGNGNGYCDFSGKLTNIKAGVLNMWSINLLAAILFKTDQSKSAINYVIGKWTVKDGLMTPDVFVLDTNKLRICGHGAINLKNRRINLKLEPTPKKPEFFNMATPVEIKGKIDDIGLDIPTGGLMSSTVNFLTSPVHVPLRRLFTQNLPEDGHDLAEIKIGPDTVRKVKIKGCGK